MRRKKVCIITSAHGPFDDRIFHKEGMSLAREGYEVVLVAPHDRAETVNGITIIPLPKTGSRIRRIILTTLRVLLIAARVRADVYHLHDPELLTAGLLMKILGRKRVIYDVHEDYETKILSKEWIRKEARTVLSKIIVSIERISGKLFDYVLTADSHIKMKFSSRTEVIANYPPLSFMTETRRHNNGTLKVIYIGGIAQDRGSKVMLETMKYLKDVDMELHLLGKIGDEREAADFMSTGKVVYHGFVPWQEVNGYLAGADAGLLLLQPTPSYVNCTGEGVIKLFEYMSMELPVIVSDFPLLKNLITGIGCGICVDPADPEKVAGALKYLYHNPGLRKEMGEKGRRAVMNKYNWENESKKLLEIYQRVCPA